jgi:hypothetical protein
MPELRKKSIDVKFKNLLNQTACQARLPFVGKLAAIAFQINLHST